MKKKCSKCNIEKGLDDFHKNKKGKHGRLSKCKACVKAWKEANKDKVDAWNSAYRRNNKEKISQSNKAWRVSNKEKIAEKQKIKNKAWREANPEKVKAANKAWREANPEKAKAAQKSWREANRDYRNESKRNRYKEDSIYRTMYSLRRQTKRLGDYKNKSTIELVGCSPESFWVMNGSPEDMSNLHVDHIVPLSWFDLSNEDHLKVCCHWSNLQYLCGDDNLSKLNRYAGSPDNVLGYKDEFDVDEFVKERIELI